MAFTRIVSPLIAMYYFIVPTSCTHWHTYVCVMFYIYSISIGYLQWDYYDHCFHLILSRCIAI